jgi:hypothetical protein
VFDELRQTGAVLYAVTIMSTTDAPARLEHSPLTRLEETDLTQQVERDRALGDGPKHSGGLRLSFTRVEGFPAALERIGVDLLHEYAVTYLLPPGTKSDGDVSIESARRGVTIRGPRRVPKL